MLGHNEVYFGFLGTGYLLRPVSRKSHRLIGSEKPVAILKSAYFEKLIF